MNAWRGYIELHAARGVVTCEIIPQDEGFVGVWIDGELADDVESRSELASSYGDGFFVHLEDYRAGRRLGIDDVWPAQA